MTDATIALPAAGYRYVPAFFQYCAGVSALDGFRIERVEFSRLLPLQAGFDFIESYLKQRNLPLLSLCACELRSPAQFTDQGFIDFNRHYCGTLQRWGIMPDSERNPVARSNVVPPYNSPTEPSFFAFSYAARGEGTPGSFVIAGSGEADDRNVDYREKTVRYGETTADAMRDKAIFVLRRMEERMAALGFKWSDTTAVQVYTVYEMQSFMGDQIVHRGAAEHGLTWHFARPPVIGLEYEMDCRSVPFEHRLRV